MKEIDEDGTRDIHCSGSLISQSHVLTSGHCFYPDYPDSSSWNLFTLYFGSERPDQADSYEIEREKRKIQDVYIHDEYNGKNAYYDVAVIKIEEIQFTIYIYPICLPEISQPDRHHRDNHQANVIGYGPDKQSSNISLTAFPIKIFPSDVCDAKYSEKTPRVQAFVSNLIPENFKDDLTCGKSIVCT